MHRAISILALAIFVIFLSRLIQKDRTPPPPAPTPVIVEIQGAVGKPGVYLLNGPTASVADALTAAGRKPADIPQLLQNETVASGQSIHVMESQDGLQIRRERMGAAALLALGMKLDLTSATAEDLSLVPGMRPEQAEAIVRYRARNHLRSIEDLDVIPGVGPKTIEKWRKHLYVPDKLESPKE